MTKFKLKQDERFFKQKYKKYFKSEYKYTKDRERADEYAKISAREALVNIQRQRRETPDVNEVQQFKSTLQNIKHLSKIQMFNWVDRPTFISIPYKNKKLMLTENEYKTSQERPEKWLKHFKKRKIKYSITKMEGNER